MLDRPTKKKDPTAEAEFKALLKHFGDREWRLDNLYFVQDESGQKVLYKRRLAQKTYAENSWVLDIIAKARQLGFCQSPETPVLTDDLEWVKIDDLKIGQAVMAVDENNPKGSGNARHLRVAVVEKKWDVFEEAFEIEFETGAKLVATGPHRYLCRQRGGCTQEWRRTNKLRVGDVIRAVTDVWGESTVEDGWFGGMLDGEGSMRWKPKGGFEITLCQTPGAVLDRARAYLRNNHIRFREDIDARVNGSSSKFGKKPVHKLVISRTGEGMRLLGKCRPTRFDRRFWIGRRLPGDGNSWVKVVGIRSLGNQRMVDIQTSESTFIAGGFVSHNSTEIAMEITDFCLFNKDKSCGIVDYKLEDAKKKLGKIRFAYANMPEIIRNRVKLIKDNEDELRWDNGSSCIVGTTHRGGTLQFFHWSEAGKTASEKPELAMEIIAGAMNTVAPGQIIKVESTAHGTAGAFHEMVERGKKKLAEGTPLTVMDFKLHFYGWMYRDDYRVQRAHVVVTAEVQEYFAKLKKQYSIEVDGDQMAWYQQKLTQLGWDKMREEFPSHIDECFFNSLEGAFFKKELSQARMDKRIGYPVPFDPTRRVHTCWDKGMNEKSDRNAIWWFQHDGVRFRWIDYYEQGGENIAHYAGVLEEKRMARKFIYGTHYGPHDLRQRIWGTTSAQPKTMEDVAKEVGIKFEIVDRIEDKEIAIESLRRAIGVSFFCSEYCGQGIVGLDNYRKTWNKATGQWTMVPFHNAASNPADAAMTGSMGVKPERPERVNRRDRFGQPKGSHWAQ